MSALPPLVDVQQGDPVVRRARVSPELVGVAAWWANMPASERARSQEAAEKPPWKDRRYGGGVLPFRPWTPEQETRMHARDKVAEYVALGYSQAWAIWYVHVVTPAYQRANAKHGVSKREEYGLYVSAQSGPAVDKMAKKYAPAKRKAS